MPQIHSYYDNIASYLSSMVEEWESLNREFNELAQENESLGETIRDLQNENRQLRGNPSGNSRPNAITDRQLYLENEQLKAIITELTQRLEDKIEGEKEEREE